MPLAHCALIIREISRAETYFPSRGDTHKLAEHNTSSRGLSRPSVAHAHLSVDFREGRDGRVDRVVNRAKGGRLSFHGWRNAFRLSRPCSARNCDCNEPCTARACVRVSTLCISVCERTFARTRASHGSWVAHTVAVAQLHCAHRTGAIVKQNAHASTDT